MRVLFYSAIFFLIMSDTAYAGECDSRAPQTRVNYSIDRVEYIRNIDSKTLTQIHEGNVSRVTGMAGGAVGTRIKIEFEGKPVKNLLYCLHIKNINLNFYAEPKIYIASNFKRGSCEYNAILRHEEKHISTLKNTHKEYLSDYRSFIRREAKDTPNFPPMKLIEMDNAKAKMSLFIQERVEEYMQIVTEEVAARQHEIDSAEEYQKITDRCHRWEEKLDDD